MILYQVDTSWNEPDRALARFFSAFDTGEDLDPPPPFLASEAADTATPISPEAREYATILVTGVCHHREAIDATIRGVSSHWRLERMARVDRNILRLGAFELTFLKDQVPRKVVINEAVEIAKTFSTAESGAFINGILDRIEK